MKRRGGGAAGSLRVSVRRLFVPWRRGCDGAAKWRWPWSSAGLLVSGKLVRVVDVVVYTGCCVSVEEWPLYVDELGRSLRYLYAAEPASGWLLTLCYLTPWGLRAAVLRQGRAVVSRGCGAAWGGFPCGRFLSLNAGLLCLHMPLMAPCICLYDSLTAAGLCSSLFSGPEVCFLFVDHNVYNSRCLTACKMGTCYMACSR